MKHASEIEFRRPDRAVQQKPEPGPGPDKWDLLHDLTQAAETFELSHRTLGVLKALLTFLPTRQIPTGAGAIVFPSNRALSARLSGMPESTLRRHLTRLVRLGIVSRHDSPNRKRYARQIGSDIALAFGFDLSPLVHLQEQLRVAAAQARAQRQRLAILRDQVMALRAQLILAEGQGALSDHVARLLRRKPDQSLLEEAEKALREAVENHAPSAQPTAELSAPDNQNERHIQDSDKYDLDTERTATPDAPDSNPQQAEKDQSVSLAVVTRICQAFQSFFPDRIRDWRDLIGVSERIAPMLGIEQPVLYQAKQIMGGERAAIVVLCMLERIDTIRNPGAYLRHLTKLAQTSRFSILPMLRAVQARELSADNQKFA